MVIRISGTQPQGPKHLETLENKTVDGTQNTVRVNRGTTGNRPISPVIGDLYFDTTLNALIQYNSLGWVKVSQDPAPTIANISPTTAATTGTVVTITGTNFKSGLSVQFTGTDSISYNSPVATFVNGTSATATTPNLLVANEPYDVKVTNSDNQFAILDNCLDVGGTPSWNTASGNIATIDELTSLSTSVSATDPDGTSIVYSSSNLPVWVSLNSSSGALTGTSPDINSDTTYSFDVTATDGVNSSSRSFNILSRHIPPGSYESIATVTVGAGGANGITFNSIPQTYTHLQLRAMGKSSYPGTGLVNGGIQLNGDANGSNYSSHNLNGDGSSAASQGAANYNGQSWFFPTTGDAGWAVAIFDILDYTNTNKFTTIRGLTGVDNNGSGRVSLTSSNWRNTAAITSITLPSEPLWVQYSSFALYGIKGA